MFSDSWFDSHFIDAPKEIKDFLAGDGLELSGKRVVDIGCGDGIIDLSIALNERPLSLIGVDLNPVDVNQLASAAEKRALGKIPENLSFSTCTSKEIPLPSNSTDLLLSWSAFEHINEPTVTLQEAHRILQDDGIFFVQVYPLFYSSWGSHLEEWLREPFQHLHLSLDEISALVIANNENEDHARRMLREFALLNRLSIDEFQQSVRTSGFRVAKFELITGATHIPSSVDSIPLSLLMIQGFKALLVKQ